MKLLGGVEAGGTKFVCAVGTGPDDLRAETRFPTTTPDETLERTIAFFREHRVSALGVASFGPLDLERGSIAATPKPGWANTDLRDRLSRALSVPVALDTDVNAAALAEHLWGAARDVTNIVYLTVGTGIGGGALVGGKLLHGLVHPEMGHVRIPREPGDAFAGACPFHGDCVEGLASGPAIEKRWGRPAEELGADHPAWPTAARELAHLVTTLVCTLSPERIIMGGGVAQQPALLPLVRAEVTRLLNGYVRAPEIVAPGLGNRSGVLGAIALAELRSRGTG